MSMTKNSAAFQALMDDRRYDNDCTYQDYLEELYLQEVETEKREEGGAPQPQQPTTKK